MEEREEREVVVDSIEKQQNVSVSRYVEWECSVIENIKVLESSPKAVI